MSIICLSNHIFILSALLVLSPRTIEDEKFSIRETLNLLACAVTKTNRNRHNGRKRKKLFVCVSCVTNANIHSRKPSSCELPMMYSRLVCNVPKTKNNFFLLKLQKKNHWSGKSQKTSRCMPILTIHSLTSTVQPTGKLGFLRG